VNSSNPPPKGEVGPPSEVGPLSLFPDPNMSCLASIQNASFQFLFTNIIG